MTAIAANENFTIRALDVTNAFLQGKPLEREVFVEPPKDLKKPGIIWKPKKTVYDKKISRVADSTKNAETLAMDKASDDTIFIAR